MRQIFMHRFMHRLLPPTLMASFLLLNACSSGNSHAKDTSNASQPTTQTQTSSQSDTTLVKTLQDNLTQAGVDITVINALPTTMPDIYWVSFENAPAMFTDKSGEYLIQGQIVKLSGDYPTDITADIQSSLAKETLAKANTDDMIIYPATSQHKASIYVFSDPTCHYCRMLHKDIKQLNAGGIEVRYLAWPRSERDIPLTEAIWCSQDRKAALTAAKLGQTVHAKHCKNPVQEHLALGRSLGVSGTPAVFAESGRQIGGYMPAKDLIHTAIEQR